MVHLLLAIIYLAAISLGLPDSLLGSVWPTIQQELEAPLYGASLIYMIVTCGTITSSLMSERLTHRFGAGNVTAVSIGITCFAIFGNSISTEFWHLCLFAIPYGLGAGSIDAALNNYVATHYPSRYMSWFHGLWGIGTIIGPYIFGYTLAAGMAWNAGYRYAAIIQSAIAVIVIISLPLWKKQIQPEAVSEQASKPLTLKETICLPGAKESFVTFFCYGAIEQTAALWASSYMVQYCNIDTVTAARYASMFYIGITAGRLASGFFTLRFSDSQMARLGMTLVACGIFALVLPLGVGVTLAGLITIGLGCAPIYPCILHATPELFGTDKSQAMIGVQMAVSYLGIFSMPPLFGFLATGIGVSLYPVYLAAVLTLMILMYEKLMRKKQQSRKCAGGL